MAESDRPDSSGMAERTSTCGQFFATLESLCFCLTGAEEATLRVDEHRLPGSETVLWGEVVGCIVLG